MQHSKQLISDASKATQSNSANIAGKAHLHPSTLNTQTLMDILIYTQEQNLNVQRCTF